MCTNAQYKGALRIIAQCTIKDLHSIARSAAKTDARVAYKQHLQSVAECLLRDILAEINKQLK